MQKAEWYDLNLTIQDLNEEKKNNIVIGNKLEDVHDNFYKHKTLYEKEIEQIIIKTEKIDHNLSTIKHNISSIDQDSKVLNEQKESLIKQL